MLQVYNIMIHHFQKLYSICSYYKIMAIFPGLYNISCALFILYIVVCAS